MDAEQLASRLRTWAGEDRIRVRAADMSAAADEIERLRRWRAEAAAALNEWGDMRSTMIPKRVEHLGLSSAAVVADEIGRLQRRLNEYENLYGPPWWVDDEDGA